MRLTIPQIIMLNHGAHINRKRAEEDSDTSPSQTNKPRPEDKDPVVFNGKRVTEMNTEEFFAYWGNGNTI